MAENQTASLRAQYCGFRSPPRAEISAGLPPAAIRPRSRGLVDFTLCVTGFRGCTPFFVATRLEGFTLAGDRLPSPYRRSGGPIPSAWRPAGLQTENCVHGRASSSRLRLRESVLAGARVFDPVTNECHGMPVIRSNRSAVARDAQLLPRRRRLACERSIRASSASQASSRLVFFIHRASGVMLSNVHEVHNHCQAVLCTLFNSAPFRVG